MNPHIGQNPGPVRQPVNRRQFLSTTGKGAAVGALAGLLPAGDTLYAAEAKLSKSETVVKHLYDSLTPLQQKEICFDWNHQHATDGLLRTYIDNAWKVTPHKILSDFYTADQQQMIRDIFQGMIKPDWHARFDAQLKDDIGGWGTNQSIAIFGTPGTGKFQFLITCRHLTLRCDGDSEDHVAFGGPIVYGHEGLDHYESPRHESNVFWHQAREANEVFAMLDGKQRKQALVTQVMPREERVDFKGQKGDFHGIPVSELSGDQREKLDDVLNSLLAPFRQRDVDETRKCLRAQGGLEKCHLAFYKQGDIGGDGVWDNWRLEGPSFVWYFRGKPHVHVWVNIADSPNVALNSYSESVL